MLDFHSYKCSYTILCNKTNTQIAGTCHCKNIPWTCKKFSDLKSELKIKLMVEFSNKCAFCQRSLSEDEKIVIDIEHVLPKLKYINYTFDIRNLVLSCRRCNTGAQKGNRTDFIVNLIQGTNYDESVDFSISNYRFLHPKIENTYNYYKLISIQIGQDVFRRYKVINNHNKLKYTFKFFNLKKLEIGSLDSCFGAPRHIVETLKKERYANFPLTV
ncbi:uncharacterized protein (TIGR02646 family) [Acinetobacter sp. BIGb0102]|uniref:HNH endonuclease n=1 Tax=Acinetobacter sp. BIGb0102 TaxID=2485131 RepID=UPI000F4FD99D|nr:HNH endonuclease [Acinetobacter sp. BIGb0102]RPE30293.1 uncharacterized protein (TIGR02646 family) [Acinetobacter sp. BIGb0102]